MFGFGEMITPGGGQNSLAKKVGGLLVKRGDDLGELRRKRLRKEGLSGKSPDRMFDREDRPGKGFRESAWDPATELAQDGL